MKNNLKQLFGRNGLIKKDEAVRLIIQCLYSLNYKNSAARLEAESNVLNKAPQFYRIRRAVKKGKWEECIQILVEIKDCFKTEDARALALQSIIEQWMQECLCQNDVGSAIKVLQKDFPELGVRKQKWHDLSSKIFFSDPSLYWQKWDKYVIAVWRKDLVTKLEKELLPPQIVVPKNRLINLIRMSLAYQVQFCLYHNTRSGFSLYEIHSCGKDHFPTKTLQILTEHKNEVWFVEFSNAGNYMASSSKDCTAIIWKVPEQGQLTIKHTLIGHEKPIAFTSWSHDDKLLATCGYEEVVKLWNVKTGACIRTFHEFAPAVRSCAWFPDEKELVFAKSGPNSCIYKYNKDGSVTELYQTTKEREITGLAIRPRGDYLICSYIDGYVALVNIKEEYSVKEIGMSGLLPITSLSVSKTCKHLLVNLTGGETLMLEIAEKISIAKKFTGYKQAKFVIHSCFGGVESKYVACGSENSQVYIWSRTRFKPVAVLPGHSMVVNSVSWNPKWPEMLASASDDKTVRIWGPDRDQGEEES